MAKIELTQGQFAIIDDQDLEKIGTGWYALYIRSVRSFYAMRHKGKGLETMAKVIMAPVPPGYQVDHINHETLDNRRENLRICTRSQNQHNKRINRNNRSGYKGVSWVAKSKNWRASIRLNNKTFHLGYYYDPENAARAYDKKAKELFGDYCLLNFPEEEDRPKKAENPGLFGKAG